MPRAVAEIDLSALRHNLYRVRELTPHSKIMAMVKGNAYGHGLVTIAKSLLDVDYFGVASIEESLALRHAGIIQPIVLLSGFLDAEELQILLDHHIQLVVYDAYQIELLLAHPELPDHLTIWLKIDTGMHRLGFQPFQVHSAWQLLKRLPQIKEVKWLTHFACADVANHSHVLKQKETFFTLALSGEKSAANSAAILNYPDTHLDIVRPGLMLYGVSPRFQGLATEDQLEPVMTLRARVVALHQLKTSETVGYGATWKAPRPSHIAVVSIGYGDGYPQFAPAGTPVWIRGQEAPLAGRVSMDSLTVDVTEIANVQIGDEVVLWGKHLPIEKVAAAMQASAYGLLTGITARVQRHILE